MKWPGQFNLGFTCVLLLAGLWVAWPNQFSAAGIAIGLLVAVGGTLVEAPFLLLASVRAKGDVGVLLLGKARAAA